MPRLLALLLVVVAVACIVGATYSLSGVLAFDWSSEPSSSAPAPVVVELGPAV